MVVRVAVDICLDERALRVHAVAVLGGVVQHVFDQGGAYAAPTQGWGNDGVGKDQCVGVQRIAGVGGVPVYNGFEALPLSQMGNHKGLRVHGAGGVKKVGVFAPNRG